MRTDLNKQLCERERHGSENHYGTSRHLKAFKDTQDCFDDEAGYYVSGGKRESMKQRHDYHWGRKSLNENLNPLWGIIRKNVGRNWDKFYSELCEVFDTRSVVNNHILEHLFQRVELNTKLDDDRKVLVQRWRGTWDHLWDAQDTDYYVDPRDGILKRNKWSMSYKQQRKQSAARDKKKKEQTQRVISPALELHLINEVWFAVDMIEQQGQRKVVEVVNAYSKRVYKHEVTEYPLTLDVLKQRHSSEKRVAVKKRSLSHKELKQYKII